VHCEQLHKLGDAKSRAAAAMQRSAALAARLSAGSPTPTA